MASSQSNGKRGTPHNARQADKQRKALELRIRGASLAEIAAQLGYADESGAHKLIKRALIETQRPAADELRTLLSMQYEALIRASWPKVLAGDIPAINAVRRIIDSLARLHLPIRIEGTITQTTETDEALQALVAELDRRSLTAAPVIPGTVVATNGEPTP